MKNETRKTKTVNPVLRQHQIDALTGCTDALTGKRWIGIRKIIRKGEGKGRIVLPTGTGKTRLEAETICEIVKLYQKQGEWAGVHVVLSPRILLSWQQLDEFVGFIAKNGVSARYMQVNSGGLSNDHETKLLALSAVTTDPDIEEQRKIPSTTDKDVIVKEMLESKRAGKEPLVIFSTYHSVEQVDAAAQLAQIKIKSYIYDEAQYCVSNGPFKLAPTYDSFFKFFFTATEKHTGVEDEDGSGKIEFLGMNNEEKFGSIIFDRKPAVLVKAGEMASVAIQWVKTKDEQMGEKDYPAMARAIIESFEAHRVVMKKYSFMPDTIGPKMIVVCNKQIALRGIMQSMREYKLKNQAVNLCALSSDFGIEVNGERTPRANNKNKEDLLRKMRAWKSEDEAIVLHVDMIAEGLDVPGITAVMPFRNLGAIKFLQNVGRGTRLVKADRDRLYSDKNDPSHIEPKDWGKYVKPYCWLVMPVLNNDYYDMKRRYEKYVNELRFNYDFKSSEIVEIGPAEPVVGLKPCPACGQDPCICGVSLRPHVGQPITKLLIEHENMEKMAEFLEHKFPFNGLSEDKQIQMLREIYSVDE